MVKSELKNSVGVRLFLVGLITIVLLIPKFMIMALVSERKDRKEQVSQEISKNWGSQQSLIGPILSIPVKYTYYDENKNTRTGIQHVHFLPESLNIEGEIRPELRNRGLYDVVVYGSNLVITGEFNYPVFDLLNIQEEDILIDKAVITIGISDIKGISDSIDFEWNGSSIPINSGLETNDLYTSGVQIKINLSEKLDKYQFKTVLNLNGSSELLFCPVGKESNINLTSDWKNPSFTGSYLPVNRTINENGFNSQWKILHVSRDFPQQWVGEKYKFDNSMFGVSLLVTVDQYQKTMRTVKYGIMFIALTFLTFFMIEILSKKTIHPIQYLLIGLALLLFYTLLLSISEYLAFKYAYLIACSGIILLITFYSKSVLSSKTHAYVIGSFLVVLYLYLYIILQLQDYALLMGSLILFIALTLVMFLTRKVDWFTVLKNQKEDEKLL